MSRTGTPGSPAPGAVTAALAVDARRLTAIALSLFLAGAAVAGCASGGPSGPLSGADGAAGQRLPGIPDVAGPVALRVEYPDSLQRIAVRDTNFIFGTVGTGDARLTIGGAPVPVEPNGAFLAWLPVPPAERGDTAVYRLVARRDGRSDTLYHPVRVPDAPASDRGRLRSASGDVWIDTLSLRTPGERWATGDEPLDFRLRAAPGLSVWLASGDRRFPLWEDAVEGRYRGTVTAGELHAAVGGSDDTVRLAPDTIPLRFVAAGPEDTLAVERDYPLRLLHPERLPVAELWEVADSVHGASGTVVGRSAPYGAYHWRFPSGTRAPVDGRTGDRLRLRLGPDLHAWTTMEDVLLLPRADGLPEPVVGDLRLRTLPDRLRLRIHLSAPLPIHVGQPEDRVLVLTLYGARAGTDRMAYGAAGRLVRSLRWEQAPGKRYRLHLELERPVWGYRTTWEVGPDGAVLQFDVRRPPAIDADAPLRGRRVAVDAGHPPVGAYGPTGYYEGDANLGIAAKLTRLLREAGAEPILIREDTLPVGLYERRNVARGTGAELFVSIHNNALGDGTQPYGAEGTSTYYFEPHSRELAESVQRGMLASMGLRDLGVYWGNLAVLRESWMPAVLTEGAFMMIPRHEAALRTDAFQEAYARGVLEGLREFLRSRADRDRTEGADGDDRGSLDG